MKFVIKQISQYTIRLLVLLFLPATIISCGGGGGVGDGEPNQPTHANLTISLQQLIVPLAPAGVVLTGIDITVYLPSGVTYIGVEGVNNGVVQSPVFDPSSNSVQFLVVDTSGLAVGPVAKIRCSMGLPLNAGAFTSANNGNPLTGFVATGETSSPTTSHDLTAQLSPTMLVSLY